MVQLYGAPPIGDPFTDRRRTGVGGSDAGAILGVSPFRSALGVWEDKLGMTPVMEVVPERMVWGSRLEGAILQGYAEDTGRKVRKGRFIRSKRYPWVIGHPDGLSGDRLIEVKTTARLDERWGEDGSADVPPHYYAQVQHYLVLTERPIADLVVLVGGREMHPYTIPADATFQDLMLEEEAAFWRLVQDGIPPEPDGSEDAAAALRRMFPRAIPEEVVATPEMAESVEMFLAAQEAMNEQKRLMDLEKQRIQKFMGARERLIGPGVQVTWPNRRGSVSWKVAAEHITGGFRDLLVPHYDDDALDAIQGSILERAQAQAMGEDTRVFTASKRRKE